LTTEAGCAEKATFYREDIGQGMVDTGCAGVEKSLTRAVVSRGLTLDDNSLGRRDGSGQEKEGRVDHEEIAG
jgi:hypothetical protein